MAGRSSRNVTYAVQEEPAFIKRFKEKIGYKEDPGIDEKVLNSLSWNKNTAVATVPSRRNWKLSLIHI